jgi:alpha-1,3-rhamnosyl/mannosyltransferase
VPEEELPALYTGAKLLAFPSLYEGFGLPVLEAMACGVPVVCSDTSSLPEVAGEAALFFDPTHVEAIITALERALADPDLRQDMQDRGLARAARFSWEQTARETRSIYSRIVSRR